MKRSPRHSFKVFPKTFLETFPEVSPEAFLEALPRFSPRSFPVGILRIAVKLSSIQSSSIEFVSDEKLQSGIDNDFNKVSSGY